MNTFKLPGLTLLLMMNPASAIASIELDGPSAFQSRVQDYLQQGKQISAHTRRIIEAITSSPLPVRIHPLTSDPDTWHPRGDSQRSHTQAVWTGKKGRSPAQGAIIYINPKRIDPGHKSYARGTLIHELVHAFDLISQRYHPDYVIREKRAVFFQNIWRHAQGRKPREHYHWRFVTDEFQQAQNSQRINEFVDYYFKFDDLPLETN